MASLFLLAAVVGAVLLGMFAVAVGIVYYVQQSRQHKQEVDLQSARKRFSLRREWLEAQFLKLAAASGRPRGLAWLDCDFENSVSFARDRASGELRALVGVAIRFEAIEGGGMEDNPNVGNVRAATAVFRLENNEWATDGRAVFNLTPGETILHFQNELEMVE